MSDNSFVIKKSLAFVPQATAPSNPAKGDMYKNAAGELLQYDGTTWGKVGGASDDTSLIMTGLGNKTLKQSLDDYSFFTGAIPQATEQSSTFVNSSQVLSGSTSTIIGTPSKTTGSGIYSYNSSTGLYTVLKKGRFDLACSLRAAAAASVRATIVINGTPTFYGTSLAAAQAWANASGSDSLNVGDTFSFQNGINNNTDVVAASVIASAFSDHILTVPETFSTDTAPLTYAGSGTYTLATLANAPVGTFITFTQAANTTARVQTTTAPTQSISDMNQNGILVYAKSFQLASTAAQPSVIAIQIGKGLKGVKDTLYKTGTSRTVTAEFDYFENGTGFTVAYGALVHEYSETTGIYILDAGWVGGSVQSHYFLTSDISSAGSANLVINASKSPALTGVKYAPSANPNLIINGNFDYWQRGTSKTVTSPQYIADRFLENTGGDSATVSRQQTNGTEPFSAAFFKRTALTSVAGAGNFYLNHQRLEDVTRLAGRTVTLSFWIKADAAKSFSLEFIQHFGSGGSPSADVTGISSEKFSIGTSWQKITKTITFPSIAGKTLGTNSNSFSEFLIWLDGGSNYSVRSAGLTQQSGTFDIAQVKLEEGEVATPFCLSGNTLAGELLNCQRYYEKSYRVTTNPGAITFEGSHFNTRVSGSVGAGGFRFKAEKRAVPTIQIFNPSTGTLGEIRDLSAGVNRGNATSEAIGTTGAAGAGTGDTPTGNVQGLHYTADAEL